MNNSKLLVSIEKSILGSFLYDPLLIEEYIGVVTPKDFYLIAHQHIFKTMINLYNENIPIDEDFLRKRISKNDVPDNIFIEILSTTPITNIAAYIDEVLESSKKRKLLNLVIDVRKNIHEDNIKSDDILNIITNSINEMELNIEKNETSTELVESFKKKIEDTALKGNIIEGQISGLKELDKKIGAFEDGDLIIIAARPSMGKTSIISTITDSILNANSGVLIESLEMPSIKIMQRLISSHSGESLVNLKKGLIQDIKIFNQTTKFYSTDNLVIHDKSYPTINQLQSRIKNVLRKNSNIKNIFVDHTGKILLDGKTREDIEIGKITSMLKKIARDFNIRVFLLQQLNRSVESRDDKRPMLSDLKNSGNIEEDADIVLGLYRDSYYKVNKKKDSNESIKKEKDIEKAEILILKNRDGEIGTAHVAFEPKCARFINQTTDMYQKVLI